MGAGLCGFWLHVSRNSEDKVKERLTEIKKILKDPASIKFIKGDSDSTLRQILLDSGVWVNDYESNLQLDMEEDPDNSTKILFDAILSDIASLGDDPLAALEVSRDASQHSLKVNGEIISVFFAGEMTWGDEPCGDGYNIIKALSYLGITQLLYNLIPWDKK